MVYERIEKPQRGGGLSPAKLRNMLMGVEKKRREVVEEVDSSCTLRSQFSAVVDHHRDSDFSESCKDVDVVREFVECSTSMTDSDITSEHKSKDQSSFSSRIKSNDEIDTDYGNVHDSRSTVSSAFEFQKTERGGTQRVPAAPFSKTAPSKWDDAEKWIASPTSNRPKIVGQLHGAQGSRKTSLFNHGHKRPATKVVVEVPEENFVAFDEPDTKRMDTTLANKECGWESDPHLLADLYGKTTHGVEKSIDNIPTVSTARSVSMRDMGTEMTPIASQEPSRTGTPVKIKSPVRSPTSSKPSSPGRAHFGEARVRQPNDDIDVQISEKEKQTKTRKEIMELGVQLGKINIAAWASKEEEDTAGSSSSKTAAAEHMRKSVIETRAEVWEEAEKAKYMARFEREEMKIQAWENHQKAKSEAELRKSEVDVERMRAKAQDKLLKKLATARHKAEEKRAAAEAKMNKQAAKTEEEAEYIRNTGRIPSKLSPWSCSCSCCC
ncbi:hypothetical protein RND81_11G205300 [Saponaria officinalis]|uniref:Remorin C-terminal domain-containing protein n=1 Tax=Saponaria officinalis TaxID=3572 RepID=A0AAW1HPE5_SAPOF